ncbi:MAG: hypothetical protein MR292_07500 [Alistipes sp.]|nr:hypothetical protein [Alistipes sp.]
MKQMMIIMIIAITAMMFGGCSGKKNDVNDVRFTIEANTDQPVRIYSPTDQSEMGTVIRSHYESSFRTDETLFSIKARCDDETTLITIRVWVNGRLVKEVSGNKYLTSGDIFLK